MPRTSCHGNSLISCTKSISADTVNQGSQVHLGDWEKRAEGPGREPAGTTGGPGEGRVVIEERSQENYEDLRQSVK